MIRVLLADDHGVIRDGLGRLISALYDVELVGVAADGAEAVEQSHRLTPDVVLMDLDMPVLDGIEATRRILAEQPETAVIVLTAFSDRGRITAALEAGARGYLLKDVDSENVAQGIRAAARGESPPARSSTPARPPTRSPASPGASARCSPCWSKGCRTS
jgi:DNA-binding NarL/FixJ family response regulator